MANWFNLELDTLPPSSPTITIANGNTYATSQDVSIAISVSDSNTAGYSIKIWGDVDSSADLDIQTTEIASSWISYCASKNIKLSSSDGLKTIYLKVRDDVYNVSEAVSDTIILDTSLPVVNINSGPDVVKISKQSGKNTCIFTFLCNVSFIEYKVKIVSATNSAHDTGIQIPITAGSINMSGSDTYNANTPITCTINGTDLATASSAEGNKIIKVFCKETSGLWSV